MLIQVGVVCVDMLQKIVLLGEFGKQIISMFTDRAPKGVYSIRHWRVGGSDVVDRRARYLQHLRSHDGITVVPRGP